MNAQAESLLIGVGGVALFFLAVFISTPTGILALVWFAFGGGRYGGVRVARELQHAIVDLS